MGSAPDKPGEADKTADGMSVQFHYIKSNHFRVAHGDGAVGGVTPSGLIHACFYSERPAIPTVVTQSVSPAGELGGEISRSGRDGIVRELEVDVLMSLQVARSFRQWLDTQIAQLESLISDSKKS